MFRTPKVSLLILLILVFAGSVLAASPADPLATPKAKGVLDYLAGLPTGNSNRIISGQFEETNDYGTGLMNDIAGIYSTTGKYPGLMGRDYMFDGVEAANNRLIPWSEANGLVHLTHHFDNPATGGDAWDTTRVDMVKLITPGQTLNAVFNGYLNTLAAGLATLQANNVTVLFKPLHEMNGNWFWWGGKNSSEYKNAWMYIFNYLTRTKGLHNLLWLWAPNASLDYTYYPGSAYVDIVGVDLYGRGTNMSPVTGYSALNSYGKPFSIIEYGACGGGMTWYPYDCPSQDLSGFIKSLKSNMPKTVLWMNWNGTYSMDYNSGTALLLQDPWVVTRDEISFSVPVSSDVTPPTVPTDLVVTPVSSKQIDLSWTTSTDDVGVIGYRIYREGNQIGISATNSYSDTGLIGDTTYTYSVSAFDAAMNVSSQSAQVSATTPVPPPDTTAPVISSISASSITTSGATIAWTTNEPADTQVEYGFTTAYGNETPLNAAMDTSHSQALADLSDSTLYHYRVKSKDAVGNSSTSGDHTFTTLVPPDTQAPTVPGNLKAIPVSTSRINVSWIASTDNIRVVGYRIYRNGAQIVTTAGTSYQNTGLFPSTTYRYAVSAYDSAGNSSPRSEEVSATTLTPTDTVPPVISSIGASSITRSSARITWTTNEKSDSQVEYGRTTSYGQKTGIDYSLVTSHSATISGLSSRTLYHYRVLSKDGAGNLARSSDRTFTTSR
jgi:chitodextrinase